MCYQTVYVESLWHYLLTKTNIKSLTVNLMKQQFWSPTQGIVLFSQCRENGKLSKMKIYNNININRYWIGMNSSSNTVCIQEMFQQVSTTEALFVLSTANICTAFFIELCDSYCFRELNNQYMVMHFVNILNYTTECQGNS